MNLPTMSRNRAAIALAALLAASAGLLLAGGRVSGAAAASEYQYGAPAPVKQPVVSGSTQAGKTLATDNGSWSSPTTISGYQYRWGRCDSQGANCAEIPKAQAAKYTLTSDDVGHRIRAYVWAVNSVGSTQAYSDPTAVVTAAASTTPPGPKVVAASSVTLPNRLVIDNVSYSQNPIRSRALPTQMRIHVVDSHSNPVQGALVYTVGVPYNRIGGLPEVATDATGWATLSLNPGPAFPRAGYLVLFVRARVQGQDALGGSSTRRLVQVTIGAPNGS